MSLGHCFCLVCYKYLKRFKNYNVMNFLVRYLFFKSFSNQHKEEFCLKQLFLILTMDKEIENKFRKEVMNIFKKYCVRKYILKHC